MPNVSGDALEDIGREVFAEMGFTCIGHLGQVRKIDVDPGGSHSSGEHIEFDYLIPYGGVCLVGEMKGTESSSSSSVRSEFRKFKRSFTWLQARDLSSLDWRSLGVPDEHLREFRNVRELRGYFIVPHLQSFDCRISEIPHVACFYKSDWDLVIDYAQSIGRYAKQHLLSRLDVPMSDSLESLTVGTDPHHLIRSPYKRIAQDIQLADLFTFQVSPYTLLPLAQVYRRDQLPNLSSAASKNFQRPLIRKKLNSIRRNLLKTDFMFPNGILVVLSHDSEYLEKQNKLTIPKRYGAISVIDGQHRLFAYANEAVRSRLEDDSSILITAIKFREADEQAVLKFGAKTSLR